MPGMKKFECATEGCSSSYDGEDYGVELTWHCVKCDRTAAAVGAQTDAKRVTSTSAQDTLTFPVRWRDQKVHWRNRHFRT